MTRTRFISFLSPLFGVMLPCSAQELVLSDDFEDAALAPHWSFDDRPFETGTIDVGGGIIDGTMQIEVTALSDFWGGFALKTERTFAASEANPLTFEITRVSDDGVGITRSGVWIANSDRSQYMFVSQNIGEGGWQYNRRIGQEGDNPTGTGANIDAFDALDEDFGSHDIRLVANGSSVAIYLDNRLGAEVDFPLAEGIVFAFGAYARSVEDDAVASFDNVAVRTDLETGLPCVNLSAPSTALFAGESGQATLSAPRIHVSETATTLSITSDNPEVATLEGANAQGTLTVRFPAGGEASKPLRIIAGKGGSASFHIAVPDPLCAGGPLTVSVSSAFIRNPSFEDSEVPAEWPGYGEIAEWMGGSGLNDGGPFGDNGAIPDRAQIAFTQGSTELSQEISGLDTSKLYQLQVFYNARNCCHGGTIDLSVSFNDQELGEPIINVRPVGDANPYHLFSEVFRPESESGTLSFITTAQGDATVVFDAVSIVETSLDDLPLTNASFEASGRVPDPGYLTRIPGWEATGEFGVNVGGSGPLADNGNTPDQDLVAFLQGPGTSIGQTLNTFIIGETYILSYAVNARAGNAPRLRVSLDGAPLSEENIAPVGVGNAYAMKSVEFRATDVTHTIEFEQTAEGDNIVLLDHIRLIGVASDIPCVPVTPEALVARVGQRGEAIAIAMPEEAVAEGPVTIGVSNSNPDVFTLEGAGADGSVLLQFISGGELTQSVAYQAIARGHATFAISSSKTLCFELSSVTATARAGFIRNPGFESNYQETWPHYGDIDEWTHTGSSGTNLADGPFHDNGLIPDGAQIGFVQGSNSLAQEIGGLEVGQAYWLQFYYNTRNCCAGGTTTLTVSYGEQILFEESPLEPVGIDQPYQFAAIPFTPEAPSGLLTFSGAAEGDATFLLDAIHIVKRDDDQVLIINPSFEATGALSLPSPGYLGSEGAEEAFSMAGWQATGSYGINSSGRGVFADNGANPDQDDVVFLQGPGSSIRQTIRGLTAGQTYTLTYAYNARRGNTPTLQADIDGNLAQETTVTPVGDGQPYHRHRFSFQASGESAELIFIQTAEGDQTILLDDIRIFSGGEARPCVTVTPGILNVDEGTDGEITVRVPDEAFADVNQISLTFTSHAPAIAELAGSQDGRLTLTWPAAGERSRTIAVKTGAIGSATLAISVSDAVCLSRGNLVVNVTEVILPRNLLSNGSFESNSHPTSPGYGPVDDWMKEGSGNSGLNGVQGPFHNNGLIPDRAQVALMQNALTLYQELRGLQVGRQYWLQFYYNAREGYAPPDLTVRIGDRDLVVLQGIEPVGPDAPYHFISAPFVPQQASAILQFESFVEAGADGTVLLDAVTITRRDPGEVVLANPSFEASGVAEPPGYIQPDSIAGWTIEGGNYGTNRSGEGPFADNGTNPDGDLVLFLQGQTVATQVAAGLNPGQIYTLQFAYNARSGNQPQLLIAVDDLAVFDQPVAPAGEGAYHRGQVTFTATADALTLSFGQIAEGDHTLLLDDIHLHTGLPGSPVALPVLNIAPIEGNALELSWPNASTDLALEASPDLRTWTPSNDPVTDRDGRFVVPVTRHQQAQFYRLRRPDAP